MNFNEVEERIAFEFWQHTQLAFGCIIGGVLTAHSIYRYQTYKESLQNKLSQTSQFLENFVEDFCVQVLQLHRSGNSG